MIPSFLSLLLAAASAAPPVAPDDVAAVVAGEPITLAEVDAEAGGDLVAALQTVHEVRAQALDTLVLRRLLAAEAARRGLDEEALLRAEVDARTPVPNETEIRRFYAEVKERLDGAPLEAVRSQIQAFLYDEARHTRFQAFAAELRAAAAVEVRLEPPRVPVLVPPDAPRLGPVDAPVQIVAFSDFECPYCARAVGTLKAVRERYGDRVSIVFRHFPLEFHANARAAAEAAVCAHRVGRFWPFHDALFAAGRALDADALLKHAKAAGIDRKAFQACLAEGSAGKAVAADLAAGLAAGVQGTPTFFVNGRVLGGAQPLDAFIDVIEDELRRR